MLMRMIMAGWLVDLRRFVEDGHGLVFNSSNNPLYQTEKMNIGHDGFESNAE